MRKPGARRKTIGLGAVALVAAVAGSVAWAAIPETDGTIHVCYQAREAARRGGADLRVIDPATGRCHRSDTELTFAQTGPRGAAGPAGAAGPQGPAGPTGPTGAGAGAGATTVLVAQLSGGDASAAVSVNAAPGSGTVVVQRSVPAGTYSLSAIVDASLTDASCRLFAGTEVVDQAAATADVAGATVKRQLALLGPATLAVASTVRVDCARGPLATTAFTVTDARVIATPFAAADVATYTRPGSF